MKESFISKYMDPTLKNENDVRNAINAQEVSLEERFYSYMVNVFPTEFKKLLQYNANVNILSVAGIAVKAS